jgi:dihydroxyacetone kinase
VAISEHEDRRGIAGTVLIDKIAGAASDQYSSVQEVKNATQKAIDNLRSIGVALTSCTVPEKGGTIFEIADDEMEFGMGVHGEPGVKRMKIVSADEIAKMVVDHLVPDLPFSENDDVVMLVNGLGATPLQELFIMNMCVRKLMDNRKINVYKTLVGNFMSSLDMAGLSVSWLKLDSELKKLFDMPVDTCALKF